MYCFVILLLFNEMQMSVRRFSAIPHLRGISADLPKSIVEARKKLINKFKAAKKEGKTAFFSRAEPDKLYIDGVLISP